MHESFVERHNPFELATAVGAALPVNTVVGREAANELFAFDLSVVTGAEAGFGQSLGVAVTLHVRLGDEVLRAVHGMVAACSATGVELHGQAEWLVRVVPHLEKLTHRHTSRIFQDQTTREIVDYVLDRSGVPRTWRLERPLQRRAYCVQYDETDLAFVKRLLAAEGICFFFLHPLDAPTTGAPPDSPREIVVFTDGASGYEPIVGSPELPFRPAAALTGMTVDEDHVRVFRYRKNLTPQRLIARRYNLRAPPIPRRDVAALDRVVPGEGFTKCAISSTRPRPSTSTTTPAKRPSSTPSRPRSRWRPRPAARWSETARRIRGD